MNSSISATICGPTGAAFHLILVPANRQAHIVLAEEMHKLDQARRIGQDHQIELANLAPGIFVPSAEVGTGPFSERMEAVTAGDLLADAEATLFNLANGLSACPAADVQLLVIWLAQLGKLVLDLDQTNRLQNLMTVTHQYMEAVGT